jgi:heme O synthase-like polyprenyltransferase
MAGWIYCAAAMALGAAFCGFAIVCARTRTRLSAKQLFLASIAYLPGLLAAMVIDKL